MENNQSFIVYASSTVRENYSLRLLRQPAGAPSSWWTELDDTTNQYLTAPPSDLGPTETWRFVEIHSDEGFTNGTDPIYGPEIDAVGYIL
jgi:hypothetical protein